MASRDFRKYEIWTEGIGLVKEVYSFVAHFPKSELYGLSAQITRAAVSIPSNIAEGCSRTSELEFKRYLEISLGSSYELETQVLIAMEVGLDVNGIGVNLIHKIQTVQKQTLNLINIINTSIKKNKRPSP